MNMQVGNYSYKLGLANSPHEISGSYSTVVSKCVCDTLTYKKNPDLNWYF